MGFITMASDLSSYWTSKKSAGHFLVTALTAAALAAASLPAEAKRARKTEKPVSADGPLTLMVSLAKQRIVVYDKDGPVTSAPISSGQRSHRTPTGVFSILQKRRRHYSNLYRGAPMPNMQRITWSGIALHAGALPGYPASHGCIRLPHSFSSKLFGMTEMGTRVVVTHQPAEPRTFAHEKLFKPLPPGDPENYALPAEDANDDTAATILDETRSAADMLFGVTPANAREHEGLPSGIERTRAAVEAYRRREISMLEKSVEKATAAHQEAADKLRTANAELSEAVKAERVLEASVREIDQRLKAAESALSSTNRNFRDLFLQAAALPAGEARAKAALEEEALEAEALRHHTDIDLAHEDRKAIDSLVTERRAAVAEAESNRDILKERYTNAQSALVNFKRRLQQAESAFERRQKPITILLSKHDGKLYVRQGYDPIFETDISFADPDAPLGTHVFHAVEWIDDGNDLRWLGVTAARKGVKTSKTRKTKRRTARDEDTAELSASPQTLASALDRVVIPDAAREFLAEHLKPGSAVIVTDERKSYETGKYTDLIVLTR